MRNGFGWITAIAVTAILAAAFLLRPLPLPATPPPIRLQGEVVTTGPPQTGLVVVPPRTIWLGDPVDPDDTGSGYFDTLDSPDDSADDSPDD